MLSWVFRIHRIRDHDTVSAGFLSAVQGIVRQLQEAAFLFHILMGVGGPAYAQGNPDGLISFSDGAVLHAAPDSFRN